MSQARIDLIGKLDRDNRKYYVMAGKTPITVYLTQAVLLIFPWAEDGKFGAEMIVKHCEDNHDRRDRRKRESSGTGE